MSVRASDLNLNKMLLSHEIEISSWRKELLCFRAWERRLPFLNGDVGHLFQLTLSSTRIRTGMERRSEERACKGFCARYDERRDKRSSRIRSCCLRHVKDK